MGVTRWLSKLWFIYNWLPAYFFQYFKFSTLHLVTTHLRYGKTVRILSQLRESDLPAGDANRTLPSSSGLLEVLPIYQLLVGYIGSKVYSVNWESLTFPSVMRTERCAQAVAYLSCCQYTDHRSIILGVKVSRKYVASVAYEHYPCSVRRMDAASIVSGNVWERFHECWHERFNVYIYVLSIFCRNTNRDSIR